jgi:hypothetical protein
MTDLYALARQGWSIQSEAAAVGGDGARAWLDIGSLRLTVVEVTSSGEPRWLVHVRAPGGWRQIAAGDAPDASAAARAALRAGWTAAIERAAKLADTLDQLEAPGPTRPDRNPGR